MPLGFKAFSSAASRPLIMMDSQRIGSGAANMIEIKPESIDFRSQVLKKYRRAYLVRVLTIPPGLIVCPLLASALVGNKRNDPLIGLFFIGFSVLWMWWVTERVCKRMVACTRCRYSLWHCVQRDRMSNRLNVKDGINCCPHCRFPLRESVFPSAGPAAASPEESVPQDEILGKIEESDGCPFDAIATIRYDSRNIRFGIMHNEHPINTTLMLARKVAACLEELDEIAKQIAVADLIDELNHGENEGDESPGDGASEPYSSAKLSEEEFERRLTLIYVHVSGDRMIDFIYDDLGTFSKHHVVVSSLNGIDFSEAWAELHG